MSWNVSKLFGHSFLQVTYQKNLKRFKLSLSENEVRLPESYKGSYYYDRILYENIFVINHMITEDALKLERVN